MNTVDAAVCEECGCTREDVRALAEWHNIDPADAICCEVPL